MVSNHLERPADRELFQRQSIGAECISIALEHGLNRLRV